MRIRLIVLVMSAFIVSFQSFGATSESSASTSLSVGSVAGQGETRASTLKKINPEFEEKHLITDTKLRADEGSMSRYSLKFNMSYYGPTLNDFGAADQPNPDGSIGVYATSLGGSMSGRYRLSSTEAISMGTGIKVLHPFHGADRTDVNNPYISYDQSMRFGDLQMRTSLGGNAITVPNYTKIGQYGALDASLSFVYGFGTSGVAVGLDTSFSYYLFSRGYQKKDGKVGRYTMVVVPSLKYNVSDKLNVNTSMGVTYWNPKEIDNQSVLLHRIPSQRLGLGYAFRKDVYFAPFLSFYPSRASLENSTLNFNTVFSLL